MWIINNESTVFTFNKQEKSMCIIIKNTTGRPVSEAIAKRSVTINSDGFGIVYLDGKGGDFRTLDMVVAERLLATETRPYVAHCRFTTVGETNTDGIHPFPLGKGRYLFQNGTIDTECSANSDTYQLAATLHGLSDKRINFLLTALSQCRWAVVNTKAQTAKTYGVWHNDAGIEYSKDNVLKDEYNSTYRCGYDVWDDCSEYDYHGYAKTDSGKRTTIAVYGTLKYGHGNHGLIKDSDFIGYGNTRNRMRLCVEGLPYVIRGKHKDGKQIDVEVYSVSDEVLAAVDSLEGHPTFYKRETIAIELDSRAGSSDKPIMAAVYMVGNEYDNGVYHRAY
jgi:gamma-glutamylcyclotransferase (GGCT)/AIG2-like uncharacterized protein YtfP